MAGLRADGRPGRVPPTTRAARLRGGRVVIRRTATTATRTVSMATARANRPGASKPSWVPLELSRPPVSELVDAGGRQDEHHRVDHRSEHAESAGLGLGLDQVGKGLPQTAQTDGDQGAEREHGGADRRGDHRPPPRFDRRTGPQGETHPGAGDDDAGQEAEGQAEQQGHQRLGVDRSPTSGAGAPRAGDRHSTRAARARPTRCTTITRAKIARKSAWTPVTKIRTCAARAWVSTRFRMSGQVRSQREQRVRLVDRRLGRVDRGLQGGYVGER